MHLHPFAMFFEVFKTERLAKLDVISHPKTSDMTEIVSAMELALEKITAG